MASFSAARSVFRSTSSGRNAAAARFASKPKASPASSPFRSPASKPLSQPIFRRPVETSFCVESMMPYHMATASALMNSMLSVSPHSYGWLVDACNDDV